MPLMQADIEKFYDGEFWTNRYHYNAVDLAQGVAIGQFIVTAERAFHATTTSFRTLRVRTAAPGDDLYTIVPLTVAGQFTVNEPSLWPLFNVIRVDFQATQGRPSRKYYRGMIDDGSVVSRILLTTLQDLVRNSLLPLVDETLTDVDGQFLVDARVTPQVGMRQLRRGSRRRTQPILG